MRWIVTAATIAAAGAVIATPTHAQTSATASAAANAKFAGTWEGTFTSDGPSGPMTLVFTKESAWKVTTTLGGEAPPPGDVRELVIEGNKASWKQAFGEYDVTFVANLNAETTQVTGTLEANQGGSYVGGGTFTLSRK
jgi:hypothetical protein